MWAKFIKSLLGVKVCSHIRFLYVFSADLANQSTKLLKMHHSVENAS